MQRNASLNCLFGSMLLTIFVTIHATAQTPFARPSPSPSPTPTLERQFFKNILKDQLAIWTFPLHLHGEDAKWAVPLAAGTTALIATDRKTGDEMLESDRLDNASRIVSYAGSAYGTFAATATFYIVGRANHDYRARETGILGAEALVNSAILVTVVKEITQRRRPTAETGRSDFFDGGTSFPSGHSIAAWSLATVVANEYHDHLTVQIAAYGIASSVSIARFTGHNHYLSDILIGSAMGYGVGRYVYHAHHRESVESGGDDEEEEETIAPRGGFRRHLMILPIYDHASRSYGASLVSSF